MIEVKKQSEDTTQKVIGTFLKRVKKYNLVTRKRKIQVAPGKVSKLRKKRKALSRIDFEQKKALAEKISRV